ncbi:hypothetical protein EGW08_005152 [Elysia chlorotica]|uniref:Uncharacterized protein n=1 Tax=Elysia chlorotica TaxID=188477 RepID=A0A3S1BRP0_ELYCH|nr:hypothetical protein EGW08_005152 [Elysia chlorotica]
MQYKDALGSHDDCGDGSEVTSHSFDRDNEDDTNPEFGSSQASTGKDSDLDIPRLKLDSLTRDDSSSSQDSQRSDVNTEERLEYSVDEMYANIDAVQTHSGNVSLVNDLSESCVFDTKDKSIADSRPKDPTSTPSMAVKESEPDSIENSLVTTTQTATCESTKPSGKVDTKNTMNLTALHNKPNAKKGKSAEVTPPQQVGLIREKEKKPNTAKADSAASMPVKKLSVEYTDPVELHSSDILQAGGVAHDPHEPVSSAWSEDTDSEEAHKVKKRQHNPLKRLFARKKGKYSPSSNTGSSILPTLESEHQNLKKEKSSSPKLFKRKKKVKIFSSESELSPSDEGFSKNSKETKKKTKNAKLTKESIIVIKSSGKSLSDSMPELAKIASTSSGTDNNNTETTLEERPKTSTHGDKDVVHEDNVGNVKNAKQNQSSDISKNNQKRHFYENVALNVSTTKKNKVKTDDNSDEDKAHNENLDPKEKPEFQVLLDNQAKAGSSPEVVDSGGTNMVMAQAKAKVGNTNEESEVAEDVYANSIFQNDSLEAADISIEMDCEYDRPPSKEISHDSAKISANVIDATIENDQELSFAKDVPSSSEPIHDIESRKKMYLYTAQPFQNENKELKIDKLSVDASSISKQVGGSEKVSTDKNSTDETSSGGRDKRKTLTSIETTDSDNEPDEKLLNAAAAENPLRRPKYAMTRLQAHLTGKPLTNEPVLTESRYADKEEMEEDQEAPLVEIPQPKRKAEKKRKHEDRIEREDISLEDDSVPDTSGFDLSPRSDASSSTATDSDITPSFDAVIQLCDSVQSPPDDQDDGERIYKNAKSLSRSPSQLLIRADVHNALESVSTPDQHDGEGVVDTIDGKGDPLHEDNIKPDEEGNKAKQVRDGTMNKRVDKDIETTQHDGNKIDDEMTDINAENLGENLSSIKKKSEEVMLQRKPDSKILERGTGEKSEAKKNKFQKVNLGKCINAVDKLSVPCSSSNQEPSSSSFDSIKDIDNESPVDVEKCMLLRSNVDEQRETRTLGNESDIPLNGANERCNTSNNDDIEDKFTTEEKTTENFEQQEKKFHVKSNEHDNKIKGISDKKNITEHENKSINCESPLTDGKKSTEGPTYPHKSKTQAKDIAGSSFPSADNIKPQNNVECVEEVIIPSASKKVECNVFAFSERLQKLDQEDVGSTQEELHKRPPSIKQRPPSWKMKTFLRKFDNVASSKPIIAPKPQRHRDSARESINSDLLQGAMKELDDFIDTELEDECDESEEPPNNTKSQQNVSEDSNRNNFPTLPTSTHSGKDKLSKNYDNMKEVVEETIMRSKAKKEKSTPFKNTLMVLDKHGSDKDKVTEENLSVEDKQSACGSSGADDSVQASTSSLSQSVPLGNPSAPSAKPDGPPPIPVKKGKEPHGKDPFLPVLSTKNENVCKDQPVVDLGYEDVLDKVSDDEKPLAKPSDNASTKETNPKTDAKQSSSPGSKRFNFPWRKKSKDKIQKHPRPGLEENQKNANHSKEIDNQDLCSQSKTKQPAVEVAAEKKKRKSPTAVPKIHKEKAAKPQKKKRKDKSDKRSKNPDVKEKNKTKKDKHNPKVTRDVPVEVYHEIEDIPSIGEETNKTKTPSSWKKDITSTSTSASSSPFSSSPLYSSDESDYEPVNYVSGKDIREDMKKRLKAEDSNGYEIPAEKTSAEDQAVPLKDSPVESNSPASPADPKQHPKNMMRNLQHRLILRNW